MCRVVGEFRPASRVDAELGDLPARCPYKRARTDVECQWIGKFADMRSHVHRFPAPPPRDVATADDRHD